MNNKINYPYKINNCDIGNDINIAFGDEGEGEETLLFIHGLANYGPIWYNNITHLKSNFRCIAIDLPGNGLSSRGDYPFTMFFYAECIAKFIEKLNLKNLTLIGHSMGGHVSIITALRYPNLVKKLALVAPSGFEHFTPNEKIFLKGMLNLGSYFISDKNSLKAAIENSFFKHHKVWTDDTLKNLNILIDEFGSHQWQKMVLANINAMVDEQVSMFLEQIQQPTLVFFGKNDLLIPNKLIHFGMSSESLAIEATNKIKNAQLVLLDNCGHLVYVEKADLFNKELTAFVTQNPN